MLMSEFKVVCGAINKAVCGTLHRLPPGILRAYHSHWRASGDAHSPLGTPGRALGPVDYSYEKAKTSWSSSFRV